MKQAIKVDSYDSDCTSAGYTEYSSSTESDVEQYLHEAVRSQRRFSLSDAQIALSYVKGKMKQGTVHSDGRRKHDKFRPKSPESWPSISYSSFHRPEKTVICHKMELHKQDSKSTFNIYTSNAEFVERPISVSMIEDNPTVRVVPAEDDNHCRALRSRSNGMFPPLPPSKPPPIQVHTSASPRPRLHKRRASQYSKTASFLSDNTESNISDVTHGGKLESSTVVLEILNSSGEFSLM